MKKPRKHVVEGWSIRCASGDLLLKDYFGEAIFFRTKFRAKAYSHLHHDDTIVRVRQTTEIIEPKRRRK